MLRSLSGSLLLCVVWLSACSEYALDAKNNPVRGDPPVEETVPDLDGVGAIEGRVCSPDGGEWVVGAVVSVETEDGVVETTTDGDGRFVLENLPAGNYVIDVKKGSFSTSFEAEVEEGKMTSLPQAECIEQGEIEIAVVQGSYDSIQDILDQFGLEYDFVTKAATTAFLRDPGGLASYDLIFFNCGGSDGWMTYEAEVADNLHDFVSDGGSIYASDLAYYVVEAAFPPSIAFNGNDTVPYAAAVGKKGTVDATVVDPAMQLVLGSEDAEIEFELASWAAMEDTQGSVLLEGTFEYGNNNQQQGPLAVRFEEGDGTVIYTSFHNEVQINVDMVQVLKEIVLSL